VNVGNTNTTHSHSEVSAKLESNLRIGGLIGTNYNCAGIPESRLQNHFRGVDGGPDSSWANGSLVSLKYKTGFSALGMSLAAGVLELACRPQH
jgi:hypothetical protein